MGGAGAADASTRSIFKHPMPKIALGSIADLLIYLVRCRIRLIGKEEAEFSAALQHVLAQCGDNV